MNDVTELKRYAAAHAASHRVPGYQALLDRIQHDHGGGPGSWVGEWSRVADDLDRRGRHLEAGKHFALARFPFVDGTARQAAQDRCVRALDRWGATRGVERLTVPFEDGEIRCWTTGLSRTSPKPLLVMMGGIVTVKEQWAPILARLRRLGLAGLVTEMPATGENSLRYRADSWRMLSAVLDAVADRADVTRTYAIALSFSGHLALGCATHDPRIRAIITMGAPISEFFTDTEWQRRLPRVTVDTLAHMTGVPSGDLVGGLADWALPADRLASLDIPVYYVASLRDEIIPTGDVTLLRRHVRRLDLIENDDVHGSPQHSRHTQLWTIVSLQRARGVRDLRTAVLNLLLRASRRR